MKKEFISGTAVLGALSFGLVAQADEVSTEQLAQAQETYETAVATESKLASQVTAQEAVLAQTQATVATAQSVQAEAEQAVAQAEALAAEATGENIAQAEQAVVAQEGVIKEKTEAVSYAKQLETVAQSKVDEEARALSVAQEAQVVAQTAHSQAQSEVNEAEKALDSATLVEAQRELLAQEALVKQAQDGFDRQAQALKETQDKQAKLVAIGQEQVKKLEETVNNAGPEFYTEVKEVELAKHEVSERDSISTPITEDLTFRDGRKAYAKANENLLFDGEAVETIILPSKEDYQKERTIDYRKVSDYARAYLVELRRINGIDIPVPEVTDKSMAWAMARSAEMSQNDVLSHDTKHNVADFGLKAETENATAGRASLTGWQDEKEIAYNVLLAYFHDYNNASIYLSEKPDEHNIFNYGHRIPLLAASGTGFALGGSDKGYGVLTFVSDTDTGVYGTMPSVIDPSTRWSYESNGETYYRDQSNSHGLAQVFNKDEDPERTDFYYNGKRVKFLPKTTFRYVVEETLQHKNTVREAAVKALEEFQVQQLAQETALVSEVSNRQNDVIAAQTDLSSANATLVNLQNRVTELSREKQDKLSALELAQKALKVAADNLDKAINSVKAEEGSLKHLIEVLRETQADVATKEQALKDAQTGLVTARTRVDNLKNAPALLVAAQKSVEAAQADVKVKEAELQGERATLDGLLEQLVTAKNLVHESKSRYEQLKDLLAQQELEAKRVKIVQSGRLPQAIYGESGQIVDYKVGALVKVGDPIASKLKPTTGQAASEFAAYVGTWQAPAGDRLTISDKGILTFAGKDYPLSLRDGKLTAGEIIGRFGFAYDAVKDAIYLGINGLGFNPSGLSAEQLAEAKKWREDREYFYRVVKPEAGQVTTATHFNRLPSKSSPKLRFHRLFMYHWRLNLMPLHQSSQLTAVLRRPNKLKQLRLVCQTRVTWPQFSASSVQACPLLV